ncbi:MAG: hypothetical protein AABX53_04110 [Nanoarchaeota archaeon]
MADTSTVLLDKRIIELLKKAKEYPRQTYNEVLKKVLTTYLALRTRNQYDEFLHTIQQPKMKELWDNAADDAWDHV